MPAHHADTIAFHADRPPAAWEVGYFGKKGVDSHVAPKPSIGVHLSVEANDLGALAPGADVSEDVLLSIASAFDVKFNGVDVQYHELTFNESGELVIRFEEAEGAPVQFRLWKANKVGAFNKNDCPGDDCLWTRMLIPLFHNPAEPDIKWFEPTVNPDDTNCFYYLEPVLVPTPE